MEAYEVKVYDDSTEWYQFDKLHRADGPAIERLNGTKEWYQKGQLHRADGPAIEYADGYKAWWQNGKLHRADGPAIEWDDGTQEWWVSGKELTKEQFDAQRRCSDLTKAIITINGQTYKLVKVVA